MNWVKISQESKDMLAESGGVGWLRVVERERIESDWCPPKSYKQPIFPNKNRMFKVHSSSGSIYGDRNS